MPTLTKILIANRGEIACRIIRTARDMGYHTVAVYSDADTNAPHVTAADEAVAIGPAPVGESYLNADKLIEACRISGADALHPGYGFLSENADFARACAAAGITFIGPSDDAIELMGSKRLSKTAMINAGVPCIPGYQGSDQSDKTLTTEAAGIGYPLMVKASAGGGGRGMRLVHHAKDLPGALQTARSEAKSAFGSDELILDRALINPRHIEIQIFADLHGNTIHLGERDCSIQRRHQKVLEEAPSPFVTPQLRAAMGQAAVNAARACAYHGAGTVEFLVDETGNFYFLEMNTRLQVEHPVTEMITGQDLVAWQLKIAAGAPLPLSQDEITLNGWAMEVRLYAEDPQNGFLPQTGQILAWEPAQGPDIRVDHGLAAGQTISPHYDPMLAKIIAYGTTRDDARRKLARAVADTALLGVTSNKAFLANILRQPVFASGGATTAFLTDHFDADPTVIAAAPALRVQALAAILMYARTGRLNAPSPDLLGWRNTARTPWHYTLISNGETLNLTLGVETNGTDLLCTAQAGTDQDVIEVPDITATHCTYLADGLRQSIRYAFDGPTLHLDGPFGSIAFQNATHAPAQRANSSGSGRVIAPMDGALLAVNVAVGDQVKQGQTLAVLEAMKMEHQLSADSDGTITEVLITPGAQVKMRQLLITIDTGTDQTA